MLILTEKEIVRMNMHFMFDGKYQIELRDAIENSDIALTHQIHEIGNEKTNVR